MRVLTVIQKSDAEYYMLEMRGVGTCEVVCDHTTSSPRYYVAVTTEDGYELKTAEGSPNRNLTCKEKEKIFKLIHEFDACTIENHWSTSFYPIFYDNGFGYIECVFFVYRARFGHHPDFLPQDEERGMRDGFSTQFHFLVEDYIPEDKVYVKLKKYREKYDAIVKDIEDDDKKWNEFPFKDNILLWSK